MNPHARHAAYVLAAYAASAIGLGALGLSSALRAHKWRRRAQERDLKHDRSLDPGRRA